MEDADSKVDGLQGWPDLALKWLLLSYAPLVPLLMNTWTMKVPILDMELPMEKAVNAWFVAVIATSSIAAYRCDLLVRNAQLLCRPTETGSARTRLLELLALSPSLVRYLPCGAPVVAGLLLASIRGRIDEVVFWSCTMSAAVVLVPHQQDTLTVVLQRRSSKGTSLSLPQFLASISFFGISNIGLMIWLTVLLDVSYGHRLGHKIFVLYGVTTILPVVVAIIGFPLIERRGLRRGWEPTAPDVLAARVWARARALGHALVRVAVKCSRSATWMGLLHRCSALRPWNLWRPKVMGPATPASDHQACAPRAET